VIGRCIRVVLIASVYCLSPVTPNPVDAQQHVEDAARNRIDTEARLRAVYGAIIRYRTDSGAWPVSLNAACDPDPLRCELLDVGERVMDFWGSAVWYASRTDGFEVRSFGLDRKARTADDLVIAYPSEPVFATKMAGCYRPNGGWWTSELTVVRLDTVPGTFFNGYGSYFLHIDLPRLPDGTGWFPVGRDSIVFQWSEGPHLGMIRLKVLHDTLRARTAFDDLERRGMLGLVRTRCDE
jgi:hypothetical protein